MSGSRKISGSRRPPRQFGPVARAQLSRQVWKVVLVTKSLGLGGSESCWKLIQYHVVSQMMNAGHSNNKTWYQVSIKLYGSVWEIKFELCMKCKSCCLKTLLDFFSLQQRLERKGSWRRSPSSVSITQSSGHFSSKYPGWSYQLLPDKNQAIQLSTWWVFHPVIPLCLTWHNDPKCVPRVDRGGTGSSSSSSLDWRSPLPGAPRKDWLRKMYICEMMFLVSEMVKMI